MASHAEHVLSASDPTIPDKVKGFRMPKCKVTRDSGVPTWEDGFGAGFPIGLNHCIAACIDIQSGREYPVKEPNVITKLGRMQLDSPWIHHTTRDFQDRVLLEEPHGSRVAPVPLGQLQWQPHKAGIHAS